MLAVVVLARRKKEDNTFPYLSSNMKILSLDTNKSIARQTRTLRTQYFKTFFALQKDPTSLLLTPRRLAVVSNSLGSLLQKKAAR